MKRLFTGQFTGQFTAYLISFALLLPAAAAAREMPYTPNPQESAIEGMRGNKVMTVPTPDEAMRQGMAMRPQTEIGMVRERDMVGTVLNDPAADDTSLGRYHILDMRNRMEPLHRDQRTPPPQQP